MLMRGYFSLYPMKQLVAQMARELSDGIPEARLPWPAVHHGKREHQADG
jgi:hypothetical protein